MTIKYNITTFSNNLNFKVIFITLNINYWSIIYTVIYYTKKNKYFKLLLLYIIIDNIQK